MMALRINGVTLLFVMLAACHAKPLPERLDADIPAIREKALA